jgi:hypothetical protein
MTKTIFQRPAIEGAVSPLASDGGAAAERRRQRQAQRIPLSIVTSQ